MSRQPVDSATRRQIRDRVDAFVRDLEGLVRRAALEAVADALREPGGARAGRGQRAAKKSPSRSATAKKGKRVRRTADQIDKAATAILDYVAKNPGKKAEEIKQALKLTSQDWVVPVKKLIDAGRIQASGEKRSTTYAAK